MAQHIGFTVQVLAMQLEPMGYLILSGMKDQILWWAEKCLNFHKQKHIWKQQQQQQQIEKIKIFIKIDEYILSFRS